MRRTLFAAPVVILAVVLAAFALGLQRDPSHIPSALIGQALPAFDLPPVRPADVGLRTADLRGEPGVLNVFASWCVSCREEHPLLIKLKADGVAIQGLDWKDEPDLAARYLAREGDPYQKVGNDRSGRAGVDLGVTGVPETYVVDRRGRIRFKQVGPIDAGTWTGTIAPLLQKLRAEP